MFLKEIFELNKHVVVQRSGHSVAAACQGTGRLFFGVRAFKRQEGERRPSLTTNFEQLTNIENGLAVATSKNHSCTNFENSSVVLTSKKIQ